jgi:hypothetical protein
LTYFMVSAILKKLLYIEIIGCIISFCKKFGATNL